MLENGVKHRRIKQSGCVTVPHGKILDCSKLKASTDDNKCDSKFEVCYGMSRKHCGKRRKCWLPAFPPFPSMFLKAFYNRVVKSRDCVVKS